MNSSMRILLLAAACVFAQGESFETTLDLHLGESGAPKEVMAELERIQTAIVFRRLPHTSICPTSRGGEFDLKKVNRAGTNAVVEHISSICTIIDVITIDSASVYAVPTSLGKTYFMRPLARMGAGLKVRITSDMPAGMEQSAPIPGEPLQYPETMLDLGLDMGGVRPRYLLVALMRISSPVVFTRLDRPALCPTVQHWDFELGKVNPLPQRFPISRNIDAACAESDSTSLDTTLVYEHYTAEGRVYYLRMLRKEGGKVRARIETEKPSAAGSVRRAGKTPGSKAPIRYRPDGKRVRLPAVGINRP